MTPIAELFSREDQNVDTIYLYPEGLFYKAYLRSAFLFIRDYGNFKPIKKYLRSAQRELVSIGFPRGAIDKYFPEDTLTTYHDGALSARCKAIDLPEYESWFEALPRFERGESSASVVKTGGRNSANTGANTSAAPPALPLTSSPPPAAAKDCCGQVIRKLRDFRLDTATPIDCMLFVAALQKDLDTALADGDLR